MQIARLGGRVVDGLKRLTHQITECRGLDRRVTEEPSLHLAGGTTAAAADSSGALGPQISGKNLSLACVSGQEALTTIKQTTCFGNECSELYETHSTDFINKSGNQ